MTKPTISGSNEEGSNRCCETHLIVLDHLRLVVLSPEAPAVGDARDHDDAPHNTEAPQVSGQLEARVAGFVRDALGAV